MGHNNNVCMQLSQASRQLQREPRVSQARKGKMVMVKLPFLPVCMTVQNIVESAVIFQMFSL